MHHAYLTPKQKCFVGLGLGLVSIRVRLDLAFCVFFWFSVDYFVLVLFAFVVLDLFFFQYCANRLARNNVSVMTYFVSSGT